MPPLVYPQKRNLCRLLISTTWLICPNDNLIGLVVLDSRWVVFSLIATHWLFVLNLQHSASCSRIWYSAQYVTRLERRLMEVAVEIHSSNPPINDSQKHSIHMYYTLYERLCICGLCWRRYSNAVIIIIILVNAYYTYYTGNNTNWQNHHFS